MKTACRTSLKQYHIPTLRCHEEVSSKLSHFKPPFKGVSKVCSLTTEAKSEQKCYSAIKKRNTKSNENTTTKTKSKLKTSANVGIGLCHKTEDKFMLVSSPNLERFSTRLTDKRITHSETERSKSEPLMRDSHFENSVDFIPVKLMPNETAKNNLKKVKKTRRTDKTHSTKEKPSKQRTTWSELLKGDVELFPTSMKERAKITNGDEVRDLNVKTRDSSKLNSQKKEVSLSVLNGGLDCEQNNGIHQMLEQVLESEKKTFDSVADPVKTLDFLIKQLRDRLNKQPANDNLQNIIIDMENALLKISYHNQAQEKKDIVKGMLCTDSSASSNVSSKPACDLNEDKKKGGSHQASLEINLNKNKLEESCFYLQSICLKQRQRINKDACEQEQLAIQLAESRRLLTVAKTREKDYEVTIGELRLKIQEYATKIEKQNENIQFLTDTVLKLRSEIEDSLFDKDNIKRLNNKLKEVVRENDILNSKLSTKDLEIEKLKVLLKAMDSCNAKAVPENIKTIQRPAELKTDLLDMPIEDYEYLVSVSSVKSRMDDNEAIACSSQASSSPRHSPSPYNSWRDISYIQLEPLSVSGFSKHIGNILQNLKQKNVQEKLTKLDLELPSSNDFSWSGDDAQNSDFKPVYSDINKEMLSL